MPPISSSIDEVKQYMSQLMNNKEPHPLSHIPSSTTNQYTPYHKSDISDMLYPTLEDNSSRNHSSLQGNGILSSVEREKSHEEMLQKNGALPPPSEIPSFYKKKTSQKNGITSALQKLTGSSSEGMGNYSSEDENGVTEGFTDERETAIEHNVNVELPPSHYSMPTTPSFVTHVPLTTPEEEYLPSPVDYLKTSLPNNHSYSDYQTSYSNANYVVPPHLSQYSYPTMRPSYTYALEKNYGIPSNKDNTQQLLLEKINYMIYLLEQQKKVKSKHTTEEFVMYSFLGVFVIYLADSFARSGRYIR